MFPKVANQFPIPMAHFGHWYYYTHPGEGLLAVDDVKSDGLLSVVSYDDVVPVGFVFLKYMEASFEIMSCGEL